MKPLADGFGKQISRDPRQDDNGPRQSRDAAQLRRNVHADGCRDGFRKERHVLLMGQVEDNCQDQCAPHTDEGPHGDSCNNGRRIFLQKIPFLIQRDRETDRCGQQQIADRRRAFFVVCIRNFQNRQEDDHENAAEEQRIEKCLSGQPVDQGSGSESRQCQKYAPH